VQAGRFDSEEDVLSYMLNPFPWLLMAVYELDQEHKIAGSVIDQASAKTSDSAATTDGESTSREDSGKSGKKSGKAATTSGDEEDKMKTGPRTKSNPSTKPSLTREVRHCATMLHVYSAPTDSLCEGAVTGQECHALFEQLDVNSDGTLSQNEIKKGLAAVKEATGLVQSAKQIFRGADADGDRSVDADEFYAYMAEQATQSEKDTMQVGPEVGPTSAFYGCIPFGMHGPTCIFWANLTPFSLKPAPRKICLVGLASPLRQRLRRPPTQAPSLRQRRNPSPRQRRPRRECR
jgi:hypothetical protein